jgi:thiosulfate/3-mercaptopyruvate sulfurtransferase
MSGYAHPDVLVSTDWVKENLDKVKLIEVDVDTKAYEAGHIEGAVGFNWQTQLQDQITRDIVSKGQFEELLGSHGISNQDTVVLYGDNNNWFAAYAFWLFKIYGHRDARLMDGGRVKWLNEPDKKLTTAETKVRPTPYRAQEPDLSIRTYVQDVLEVIKLGSHNLVDVRSVDEFTGKIMAPPGLPETAQRAGHIPGARNVPWSMAVKQDGTFKGVEELQKIYLQEAAVDTAKPTIAYCRIGERSSHTWFVLKYLLGLKDVRNYDGSWTEYGSMVGLPIEKTATKPVTSGV